MFLDDDDKESLISIVKSTFVGFCFLICLWVFLGVLSLFINLKYAAVVFIFFVLCAVIGTIIKEYME